MKINENIVRFKGSLPIGKELESGTEYTFKVVAEYKDANKRNNQDGTVDWKYVMEVLSVEIQ